MFRAVLALSICSNAVFAADPTPPPDVKAWAIKSPRPHAPAEARTKHLKGAGVFVIHIRSDGSVSHVAVERSTGHAILDKAAIDAFSQWRFIPSRLKVCRIPVIYNGDY